jgi:hypothetical protein
MLPRELIPEFSLRTSPLFRDHGQLHDERAIQQVGPGRHPGYAIEACWARGVEQDLLGV